MARDYPVPTKNTNEAKMAKNATPHSTGRHQNLPVRGSFYATPSSFERDLPTHMTDLKPSGLDLAAVIEEKPPIVQQILLPTGSPFPTILLIAQDTSLIAHLEICKTWQTDSLLAFGGLKQLQQGSSDKAQAEMPLLAPCAIAYAGDGLHVMRSCQAGQVMHAEMPSLLVESHLLAAEGPAMLLADLSVQTLPTAIASSIASACSLSEQSTYPTISKFLPLAVHAKPCLALFGLLGKINHSCRPNANLYFNESPLTAELRALRNIEANEEIIIAYCNPCHTKETRQLQLKNNFGFSCFCEACTSPLSVKESMLSDFRRDQIQETLDRLLHPDTPFTVNELKRLLNTAIEEKLHIATAWVYFSGGALMFHIPISQGRGRHKRLAASKVTGLEWLNAARKLFIVAEGPGSKNVQAIESVVENQHNLEEDKQQRYDQLIAGLRKAKQC